MRCLTLAEELRNAGADVQFVTRSHEGNLNSLIADKDFALCELPSSNSAETTISSKYSYASWLGAQKEQDAQETIACLNGVKPDWLIVDHYALNEDWEQLLRPHVKKIMVIDDLVNRSHDCDLLLDQNYFNEPHNRYNGLIPSNCIRLLGPEFTLLRSEFINAHRTLKPRNKKISRLFVFFGGCDPDNLSGMTLDALSHTEFANLYVDVVIGGGNPHLTSLEKQVRMRPLTYLHVEIDYIANLMTKADLAVGAGGTNIWERIFLNLPSIVITTADNQKDTIKDLSKLDCIVYLGEKESITKKQLSCKLLNYIQEPKKYSDFFKVGNSLNKIIQHILL